jgi:hypothetical protein
MIAHEVCEMNDTESRLLEKPLNVSGKQAESRAFKSPLTDLIAVHDQWNRH